MKINFARKHLKKKAYLAVSHFLRSKIVSARRRIIVKRKDENLSRKRNLKNPSEGNFLEKEKSLPPRLSVLYVKEIIMLNIAPKENIKIL